LVHTDFGDRERPNRNDRFSRKTKNIWDQPVIVRAAQHADCASVRNVERGKQLATQLEPVSLTGGDKFERRDPLDGSIASVAPALNGEQAAAADRAENAPIILGVRASDEAEMPFGGVKASGYG
jgi:hypothetical protein